MALRLFSPAGRLLNQSSGITTKNITRSASNGIGYKQALANLPATQLTLLDNGMKVASEEVEGPLSTVSLYIDAGSRYETSKNNGVAKFFERMSFKGTSKRNAVDLESEVASMGARIESFTGREQTGYVATCLNKDVPKMVELLGDVVENSVVDPAEVERQREAILEEMKQPEDMQTIVTENLHSVAFQGTPLGLKISGNTQNIRSLTADDILSYRNNNFTAPRMVLTAAGGINHSSFAEAANKHLGKLRGGDDSPMMPRYCRYTGSEVRMRDDDLPNACISVGFKGCSYNDPDRLVLEIASTLFSDWNSKMGEGENTSHRMAMACSMGHLADVSKPLNFYYRDTGLFNFYFVTHKMSIQDLMFNFYQELMCFCETATEFDVQRGKNLLRTRLLLQNQSPYAISRDMANEIMYCGRKTPFAELDAQIADLDGAVFREVCNKYIYDKCPVVSAIGPIEALAPYVNIRNNLFWLRV